MSEIVVLRLGHRVGRDERITTHVGLVARAFGARGLLLSEGNERVERSIRKVNELWGGDFFVKSGVWWKEEIKKWKAEGGGVVHLTMYGLPLNEVIDEIRGRSLLVIVGAEKVPAEVYSLADFNVAVGSQPHSEVAALAVFLDRFFEGRELEREFRGWRLRVVPSRRGKEVIRK